MWSECWIKLKPFPCERCFHVGIVCVCVCLCLWACIQACLCVTRHRVAPIPRSPPGTGEHLQPSIFHMPRASQSHSIINSGWLWINKPPSLFFFLSDQLDFFFFHSNFMISANKGELNYGRQSRLWWTVRRGDDAADAVTIVIQDPFWRF